MRRLIASTFTSLDGVMQAPGAPDEDRSGGFALGGWQFAFEDSMADLSAAGFDAHARELLLGRRTYEIFAAYWPHQADDNPIAASFNATRKHVATRSLQALHWHNTVRLGDDVPVAVAALKRTPGPDLQVIGSGALLQTLHAAGLVDEYNVWTYPLVLGNGKRLFEDGAAPVALRRTHVRTSSRGAVMATYVPDGAIRTGTVGPDAADTGKED